ncbi:MAG TPA: histidinol-phosphatase HisJ family protein [Oscillospiraceae bacterium]|nr:histidinol-phosphatase HisJ family protein [Oscillospiraceae bacterium]
MKVDYHLHTARCGHATGTMAEYLAVAEAHGVTEVGFADHFPLELLGYVPQDPVNMPPAELPAYIAEVQYWQKEAPLAVRLGAEVDYLPGREKLTAAALAAFDFDYLIGSVHFLADWDFTHPAYQERFQEVNMDRLYAEYFALIQQLAQSGLFQIVGHLDVLKKFAYFPSSDWSMLVEETCQILKATDMCVEVNTAGWRAPVREVYPGVSLLRKCQQLGIPVTLGSDAHQPQDVGRDLERALLLLEKLGFREITTFARRQRKLQPLVISS